MIEINFLDEIIKYEVIKDDNNCIDLEVLNNYYTDYFKKYDYIVGDISYSKLRLKGFYNESNKNVSNINNIKNVDNYISNNCAYKCKYFIIKKIIEKQKNI